MANSSPTSSPPKGISTPPQEQVIMTAAATKTYELTACAVSYTKPITSYFFPTTTTSANKINNNNNSIAILHNISFTARPAELLAIVGPSGAGKSTLLDILSAHLSPTSGRLLLNSSPHRSSSYRKLSSYVPQHDSSLPLLTVHETFLFAARLLLMTANNPSQQ